MSITRSYNNKTGISYAYETSYVWDEARHKKVQHKQCIGQFDPETGEIIPNGRRGRPRKVVSAAPDTAPIHTEKLNDNNPLSETMAGIAEKLSSIEKTYHVLESEVRSLGTDIALLKRQSTQQ